MMFVKHTLKKDFVMPLKSNRKLALSLADKRQGRFVPVETLELNENAVLKIYLEGVGFPLLLLKQVFTCTRYWQKRRWQHRHSIFGHLGYYSPLRRDHFNLS